MPSTFDSQKHHRHSSRLPNYVYAQPGAYYVTIVAWHRECLFGEVVGGEMRLNEAGKIVRWEWLELPERLHFIELGAFVVMPNHFHGILIFHEKVGATRLGLTESDLSKLDGSPLPRGSRPASLGAIMAQFKSRVTKRLWKIPAMKGRPIWQRNYGVCPEPVEGSTLSVMTATSKAKRITSKRIPRCGTRVMEIR